MDAGWVRKSERAGGRTPRFEHRAGEQLAVEKAELAILTELLNRGPQAPGALKGRASRMHPFPSPADVERVLESLAARPVPYVKPLPRRPREHAARWTHLLGPTSEMETGEPAAAPEPEGFPEAPARRSPPPPLAEPEPDGETLLDRIATLEQRVQALSDRLDRLEGRS